MRKIVMLSVAFFIGVSLQALSSGTQTCGDANGVSYCTNTTYGFGSVGSATEVAVADQMAAMINSGATRGGPGAGDLASIKAGQEAACKYITAQTKTDETDCKASVDFYAKHVPCSSDGGTVNWNFSWKGVTFGLDVKLDSVAYGPTYNSVAAPSGCLSLINSARTLTLSKCSTTGETLRNKVCLL